MRVASVLVALLLIGFVFAATQVDRIKVDDYQEGTVNVVIILNNTVTAPNTVSSHDVYDSPQGATSTAILGGERDLQYTVTAGLAGRVFSTAVATVQGAGQWSISTPNQGTGTVLMQYDGIDGSMNLNVKGFTAITGTSSGIDLTEGGLGKAFHLVIKTDLDTTFTLKVYSPDGTVCTNAINVPGNPNAFQDSIVNFSSFAGNCAFTNVGAIEAYVAANANVDTIITLFATYGDPNPTTPTATASISRSASPSRGASPSQTPSATPSPSKGVTPSTAQCYCQCPAFTCELIFDLDDDQNKAYLFVDDDGFGGLPAGHYFGGYGYYYAGERHSNSASSIILSLGAVIAVFAAIF